MKNAILLILGFALVNNYALTAGLGLTPLLGFASRRDKILVLGLSVTGVMLVSYVLLWLLGGVIPAWAQLIAAAAIVLALVYLAQLLLGKKLGLWFPVIALNSAALGLALNLAGAEDFVTVLCSALGAGLGFLLALFLMNGLEEKIEDDQLPKAFRGWPIRLLAAAIVALAVSAFKF